MKKRVLICILTMLLTMSLLTPDMVAKAVTKLKKVKYLIRI